MTFGSNQIHKNRQYPAERLLKAAASPSRRPVTGKPRTAQRDLEAKRQSVADNDSEV